MKVKLHNARHVWEIASSSERGRPQEERWQKLLCKEPEIQNHEPEKREEKKA